MNVGEHSSGVHPLDVASGSIVLMWMNNWLPAIATLLTVIWFAIRIYETVTVQKFIRRLRKNRKTSDEGMPTEME